MNNYFPVVAVQKEKEKIISDLVQAGIGIIILPGKVFNIVSLVLQARPILSWQTSPEFMMSTRTAVTRSGDIIYGRKLKAEERLSY